MKYALRILIIWLLTTGLLNVILGQNSVQQGKAIFSTRCAACHAIGKQVVGPDLKDVDTRRSEAWIIDFVHGSQKLVQAKDAVAVHLFEQFNHTVMPDHPDLSAEDIRHIIAYIHDQSAALGSTAGNSGPAKELYRLPYPNSQHSWIHNVIFLDLQGHFTPLTSHDHLSWIMIFTTVLFLVVSMVILVKVTDLKNNATQHTENKENTSPTN
ncbi:Cytochrome c553 [Arachidicoccus rhizosphaerae]|uniref:Cytochrome c553 n=1 Tax=Arachidicoccus rhizosphaerae TaxID=551991 RepID=A0A1H4BJY3_9BACT|nr:cytochrome c [Arachidicoccus rhizosphaerae]SEA48328.1 Cytochrome c553 [Arachidicoccus rhizosphaerae]